MSILVAYASKHGATGGIAERIGQGLRATGQHAEARLVQEAGDLGEYEGFVVGSAAYSTHWLRDATAFVRRNQDLLAQRPVWLFSSGPLGAEAADAKGADLSGEFEPRRSAGSCRSSIREPTASSSVPSIPAGSVSANGRA
jgi:menaquinone-dependent protoporphyrinogen oxidase